MSVVRDVVDVLARALTDKPDDVQVVESKHKGTTLVELFVGPGELGKVIGKQGRTAAALRTLAATAAEKEGTTVTLEIPRRPAVNWDDMAVVGRIARPHGIRGQVILNAETDFPEERFQPGNEVFIERRGGVEPLTLTTVRFHRGRPIVGVSGVESIDEAQELAGLELRVPAERLVRLPAGTFYRHDLVGCRVETRAGTVVGIVSDVDGTLAASRLVVTSDDGEILIPLVSADLPGDRRGGQAHRDRPARGTAGAEPESRRDMRKRSRSRRLSSVIA